MIDQLITHDCNKVSIRCDFPLPFQKNLLSKSHCQSSSMQFQRFLTNSKYYEKGGPVFLLIGGEASASKKSMYLGEWIETAKEFHALCVQLEHRFYGKSQPFKWVLQVFSKNNFLVFPSFFSRVGIRCFAHCAVNVIKTFFLSVRT